MNQTTRFEHKYHNGRGGFTVHLGAEPRAVLAFQDEGTMEGAHALIEAMEEMERTLAPDEKLDAKVDLSLMRGAPLRSQFLLGKWMIGRRQRFGRLAVFGGRKVEMSVAKAVMKIAGLTTTVGFFDQEADATRWIGW